MYLWGMNDIIIVDDYVRYPILEGESLFYENFSYSDFLRIGKITKDYWEKEDKKWFDRVRNWAYSK